MALESRSNNATDRAVLLVFRMSICCTNINQGEEMDKITGKVITFSVNGKYYVAPETEMGKYLVEKNAAQIQVDEVEGQGMYTKCAYWRD